MLASRGDEPASPDDGATSHDVGATTLVNVVAGATQKKTAREDYARLM